ncbi:hypothetical protein BDQ17DRAFT_1542889 [Cyathus striatus]|nr:hypothetical protein BDQ17DRAFT_1542889 [Cyathus striatus]
MVEEALHNLTVELFVSNYQSAYFRTISTLSALIVLLFEYVLNFQDEFRFVWRKPRITTIKVVYLISRYGAILTQIVNLVVARLVMDRIPVSKHLCKIWFIFHMTSATGFLFALDIVLMIRVYALYNCDPKVGTFLATLLITQAVLVSTFAWRSGDIPLSISCNITTKQEILAPSVFVIGTHLLLLAMTMYKRKVVAEQSALLDLVVRDGTYMFVFVFSVFTATIPYSLVVDYAESHVMFVWPTTFFSVFACRLILNMRNLRTSFEDTNQPPLSAEDTSVDFEFTSFFDTRHNASSSTGVTIEFARMDSDSAIDEAPTGLGVVQGDSVPSTSFGSGLISRVSLSHV